MIPDTKRLPELEVECAGLLAAQGAIMTLEGSPVQHFLVGDFAWIGPRHVYWFAAHGDRDADAHLLEFEEVDREGNHVHFLVSGKRVATIAAIDDTEVDDPDDFLIAWQIWQQVAPMRRMLLERSREECASLVRLRPYCADRRNMASGWNVAERLSVPSEPKRLRYDAGNALQPGNFTLGYET